MKGAKIMNPIFLLILFQGNLPNSNETTGKFSKIIHGIDDVRIFIQHVFTKFSIYILVRNGT